MDFAGRSPKVDGWDSQMLIGRTAIDANACYPGSGDPAARAVARGTVIYSYVRLVGYDENLNLVPDILEGLDTADDRSFTLHLRPGHRWSDGTPFTSEDFRYFWQDAALNDKLSPTGPPIEMLVEGKPPKFEVLDEVTVRYTWDVPNPAFQFDLKLANRLLDEAGYRTSMAFDCCRTDAVPKS